ncbi:MAG: hypothetical protein EXR39_16525 [Betaproteobacteria bacterium]|nr:hypothetical protein [Betaproteobacteria bacterium]
MRHAFGILKIHKRAEKLATGADLMAGRRIGATLGFNPLSEFVSGFEPLFLRSIVIPHRCIAQLAANAVHLTHQAAAPSVRLVAIFQT